MEGQSYQVRTVLQQKDAGKKAFLEFKDSPRNPLGLLLALELGRRENGMPDGRVRIRAARNVDWRTFHTRDISRGFVLLKRCLGSTPNLQIPYCPYPIQVLLVSC